MGLGYVAREVDDDPGPDGGPTLLLSEAPFEAHCKGLAAGEDGEKLLSLVSLNERTAPTVEFCRSQLIRDGAGTEISCGRDSNNNVVLEDKRVSSRHFSIQVRQSASAPGAFGLKLVDESSNGTWVNDKLVGKDRVQVVRQGDRIFVLPSVRVGHQECIGYVVLTAPVLTAPPPPIPGKERHLARVLASSAVQCRLCGEAPVHKCITAVPCGHNFDLGCLLAWRFESDTCPTCGEVVRQAVRNRVVDGMTETFLQSKPEARRPAETLRLLQAAENCPANAAALEKLQSGALLESQWEPRSARRRARTAEDTEADEVQLPSNLKHLQRYAAAAANPEGAQVAAASSQRSSGPSSVCTIS
eukprot:TRINITY_DN52007_c0_g1_i1.p1 TRINITY_DN52007_c0_g1~~TRINITY_DN52007_c0_g1_i1.p1  ORF type:complete len:369 (+),score=54.43 TRINITY_DN52007_c0_g1_i1:35-1108(+)